MCYNPFMVKVTRVSFLDGVERTIEIPLTEAEFTAAFWAWRDDRVLIQDAFPTLTPGQREFIKSGITDEQWEELFNDPEEM